MNVLYLHGLDGELSVEKEEILEKYAKVIAPNLCYRSNNKIVEFLFEKYSDKNIDIIIGSSMGGYAGYFLSSMLKKPGLFFNPALPYRNVVQFLPRFDMSYSSFKKIIIGKQDDTIDATCNLNFLMNTLPVDANTKIAIINKLEHRIPIQIFKEEIDLFFKEIK